MKLSGSSSPVVEVALYLEVEGGRGQLGGLAYLLAAELAERERLGVGLERELVEAAFQHLDVRTGGKGVLAAGEVGVVREAGGVYGVAQL